MRTKYLFIVALLLVSAVYASDRIKAVAKSKKITVSGVLDTSSIPYRLLVNSGYQNQEIIFVRKINFEDSVIYSDTEVTVSGKVSLFQERQYIISVESIRKATPEELESFKNGF